MEIGGIILAIIGIILTIYGIRKSKQEKKLIYEVSSTVNVAEVLPGKSAYSLKVIYRKPDSTEANIDNAFTHFIRFTNCGHIPIKKSDLTENDSLRIEILEGNVLAASLISQTRNACNIVVRPVETDVNEDISTIRFEFDFLDYLDGGIIQILTGREYFKTNLKGTIIGMPKGIERVETPLTISLPNWGCVLTIISYLITFGASFAVVKLITGTWTNFWLLFLPVIALIIPIGIVYLIFALLGLKTKSIFPKQLTLPQWYLMKQNPSDYLMLKKNKQ
jgi:hypothetical protein